MIIKHCVKLSRSFHSEIVFIMILSKVVLLLLSLGQDIIKCGSSSTSREHNLQSYSSLVALVYLPVSISNLCAEILSEENQKKILWKKLSLPPNPPPPRRKIKWSVPYMIYKCLLFNMLAKTF